jgi:hypothetical protein
MVLADDENGKQQSQTQKNTRTVFGQLRQDIAATRTKQRVGRAPAEGSPHTGLLLGQLDQDEQHQEAAVQNDYSRQDPNQEFHIFSTKRSF